MSINPIGSNIPIQISFGGTNAASFATIDGTVIYDGVRLVTTTTGSIGQILTSNGPGVAPTYQNNGGITGVTLTTDDGHTASGANINIFGAAATRIVTSSDNAHTLKIDIPVNPFLLGLTTSSTGFTATTGNITASTGNFHAVLGDADIDTGNVNVTLGNVNITAGVLNLANSTSAVAGVIRMNNDVYFNNFGTHVSPLSNLFVGRNAGNFTLTPTGTPAAQENNAFGELALSSLTTGGGNSAFGNNAGAGITTGQSNAIFGGDSNNQVGIVSPLGPYTAFGSTMIGMNCGPENDIGDYNTCLGYTAGFQLLPGDRSNICLGADAASTIAGTSRNIRIGFGTGNASVASITRCFISGITGIAVAGGAGVFVTNTDQLGVHASSARFKNDIQDMGSSSNDLLKLRPVTFVWNKDSSEGLKNATDARQFGLIAEEVAQIMPDLVNYDESGKPFNINYAELTPLLLNELKKANALIVLANARVSDVETEMLKMKADIRALNGII